MPKMGPTVNSADSLLRAMTRTELDIEVLCAPHGPAVLERQRNLDEARLQLRGQYDLKRVLGTDAAFTQVKQLEGLLRESMEEEHLQISSLCSEQWASQSKLSSLRLRDRGRNLDFSAAPEALVGLHAGKKEQARPARAPPHTHMQVPATPKTPSLERHDRGRRRVSGEEGPLGIEEMMEQLDGTLDPRARDKKLDDGRSETVIPRRPPPQPLTHGATYYTPRFGGIPLRLPNSRSTPAARPPSAASRAAAKSRKRQARMAHEQVPAHTPSTARTGLIQRPLVVAVGHALQQAWVSAISPQARRPPKAREAKHSFSATKLWNEKDKSPGKSSQGWKPQGTPPPCRLLSSSSAMLDQTEEESDELWEHARPFGGIPLRLELLPNSRSTPAARPPVKVAEWLKAYTSHEETGWTFRPEIFDSDFGF